MSALVEQGKGEISEAHPPPFPLRGSWGGTISPEQPEARRRKQVTPVMKLTMQFNRTRGWIQLELWPRAKRAATLSTSK